MEPNNLPTRAAELTVQARKDADKYINNFIRPALNTTTDVDAVVQSYFETVTNDVQAARLLSTALVLTSLAQNLNPMKVLADFKKLPPGELNTYLATFLNLNRVNTSLLGLTNRPQVSVFVQRGILA
jgi:hypothetical protein